MEPAPDEAITVAAVSDPTQLPDRDDYYLALAFTAARRANCLGRKVGAILVKGDRVIATGYNGTAEGLPNCLEGGCLRCADRDQFVAGTHYAPRSTRPTSRASRAARS